MLDNITVKMKLFILLILSVLGFTLLSFFMYKFIWETHSLGEIETEIEMMKSDMLMLRRNEKDFILRKDLKYKTKFDKNYNHLVKDTKVLIELLDHNSMDTKLVNSFLNILKDYKSHMHQYIALQQTIGLNETIGLYGSLRRSVHSVQDVAKKLNNYELLAKVYDLRKQEKDFMLRRNLKYVDKYKSKIDKLLNNKTLVNDNIKVYLENYKKDFLSLIDAEVKIGLSHKEGLQGTLRKTIHKTETLLKKLAKDTGKKVENKIDNLIDISILISLMLILASIGFILILNRNISKSISDFQNGLLNFFKYLNKETSIVEKLDESSKDELGQMAIIVNKNIEKTKKIIDEDNRFLEEVSKMVDDVNKGYLFKRFENKVDSENLEQLRRDFNIMLENLNSIVGGSTNKILNVLESYAKLDFTNGIKDDNAKIPLTLNNVNKLINEMLVENKENGLTLEESSAVLLNNVESLSVSSNQAATSLEETAAALEEITSNISNNTNNVVQMASHANEVTTSVSAGQSLASKTTIAMDEINEEVMAINEAISVIDQISFQTNILSLNAAVEAATAGEAGKGFAVVAQEVRNLASRSAEAANEIKKLVENATTKANNGKIIADEMIHGYTDLNQSISKTIELINDVENASKEQLTGIEQINNAVSQLDQQTQQNASVANNTKDIAIQTQAIAQTIVKNADEKEFVGKDSKKAKKLI